MSGKIALESGQEIDLKVDGEKYQASVHGFMACTECHIRFGEDPHKSPAGTVPENIDELSKKIGHKARVDAVAYSACVNCHEGIYDMVLESPHGENIVSKNEMDAALCLDCHGSPHYIVTAENEGSRVNQWSIVETCGHCHGDKELTEKYNIETNVLTSYIESFHGKKHHLGHKGAPTCVNCHGAHDIKRKDDPSSPVFEANKKATCGKCHKGATDKFVAAITHKPVGPIPHYMEIGLILLTLSTFAFIISHVILEAFSDIRDALSKKKEARK
ncbi:MAG: hypothetical protein JSV21_03785 [Nitrospirota bacterium]|nr:MAG: hypothetical protein JSV21_03785 [Nitrospirota bacterium]